MREIKMFALVACVFGVSGAHAHDVIDMSALFSKKKQERRDLQQQEGCAQKLDGSAKIVQLNAMKSRALVPITNIPTMVDISENGVTVAEPQAITFEGATQNIQSVFMRLTDLRLHKEKFKSQAELDGYANLMYLGAKEVFKNDQNDARRLKLLTANFLAMDGNFPPDLRYKFLTNFLAGIEMSYAFNMDDNFPSLLLEWRVTHMDSGFRDPMDEKVLEKCGLTPY